VRFVRIDIGDDRLIFGIGLEHSARVGCRSKNIQFFKHGFDVLEFKANQIKERKILIAGTKAQ
jgi:Mg2+/Co2+ transporter CorB